MKPALNEKAEKVKEAIKGTEEKSKEMIRGIVEEEHKHLNEALDSTKHIAENIKEQLKTQKVGDAITKNLEASMDRSIEFAEEALDGIINSYSRQMELNTEFNTKLVDALKNTTLEEPENLLKLIQDNFEASRRLTIENTKQVFDLYNKHTDLALRFNESFKHNLNGMLQGWQEVQNNGLSMLTGWATDWWKHLDGESKKGK